VLVGDVAPELGEIVCAVVKDVIGGQRPVEMTLESEAGAVLARPGDSHFDLFVIVLNNVLHRGTTPGERVGSMDRSLQVVTELRAGTQVPIVALSGQWRHGLEHEVEQAGADIFFQLPFAPESLREQLELRMAAGR
jgi:CheY-like chemotaxis protein